MHHILLSILRTGISFFILMVIALWIGKQVNSKNNYYNFALSMTIGSFIANMGFDINLPFAPMLSALFSLVCIYFILYFQLFPQRAGVFEVGHLENPR